MIVSERLISAIHSARAFQQRLLDTMRKRKDTILQLVEALACSVRPSSVVELSQLPAFQRTFSNISRGIAAVSAAAEVEACSILRPLGEPPVRPSADRKEMVVAPDLFQAVTTQWTGLFAENCPKDLVRPYRLLLVDATPNPRRHAVTLPDRGYVHEAGHIGTPVTVGLQASLVVALPEDSVGEATWALPLSVERIATSETPCEVASRQIAAIALLPAYQGVLTVVAADSGYSILSSPAKNVVVIARSRKDRTGRRPHTPLADPEATPRKPGRPRKYEPGVIRFAEDLQTDLRHCHDLEEEYDTVYQGVPVTALASRWNSVLLAGRSDEVDVVKIELFAKNDSSQALFKAPLLLIISGERRREVSSFQAFEAYLKRFQIEHFFRFQKQELLFCGFATPDLQQQVNWWWICMMAYWLLFLTRELPTESDRPWMPKRAPDMTASPGQVKRSFGSRIFPEIGSPTRKPKTRGKSPGRKSGSVRSKRPRFKPVKKVA